MLEKEIRNEQIKLINTAIELLSKDYAEILYAYYIEDKTLQFIAEELKLPLGTVKWKLSEIRKKLKEYLKMERLNGKKTYIPSAFQTHRSGGSYSVQPEEYTTSLINQNLLYYSYGNPCSLEDYSLEMGMSLLYIKDIVERLESVTLLKKDENGKYLTNFAMIDKKTDEKILKLLKQQSSEYTSELIQYCKNHFHEWKKLVDNLELDDNKLMWAYLFNVNRKTEQLDCTKEETMKHMRKHRHVFDDGSWDYYMSEEYDSDFNNFGINECGNRTIGIQGFFYSGNREKEQLDSEALKCILWEKSANWDVDFELFDYLIEHKEIRYSDCIYTLKSAVDKMVEENYLHIKDDKIIFNFVLLDFEKAKKNKETDYNLELNKAKQKRKEITREIEEILKICIPEYLHKDLDYVSFSYFVGNMRQYVVRDFEKAGLIYPILDGKRIKVKNDVKNCGYISTVFKVI